MLHLHPYLGSDPRMVNLLSDRMAATFVEAWIFVNHGTRSSAGEIFTEQLTATLARWLQVPVIPASWSVAPGLSDRARTLIERGHQRIGIFSYFLFPGGIPDAIDQAVDALCQTYPTVQFFPTPPLSVGAGLVNLLQAIVSWEMHLPGQAIAP
ncbi:MAG: hypothetical protein HC925_07160 [Coleofasciculaceae cyanobacterium SM2_3_26]|nr:hypothetical protein [Coleofasciculaceae cyanobacterium SM2_3_26]